MDIREYHAQYFTATIVKWQHLLKPDKYKDIIAGSLEHLSREGIAEVNSFVIMSNHFHLIWQIKERSPERKSAGKFP